MGSKGRWRLSDWGQESSRPDPLEEQLIKLVDRKAVLVRDPEDCSTAIDDGVVMINPVARSQTKYVLAHLSPDGLRYYRLDPAYVKKVIIGDAKIVAPYENPSQGVFPRQMEEEVIEKLRRLGCIR